LGVKVFQKFQKFFKVLLEKPKVQKFFSPFSQFSNSNRAFNFSSVGFPDELLLWYFYTFHGMPFILRFSRRRFCVENS